MRLLFSFLLLFVTSAPAGLLSQAPVEPIRVTIRESSQDRLNAEFNRALARELNKLGHVEFVSEKSPAHFDIVLSVAPLAKDIGCVGYAAAMTVRSAKSRGEQSIHTGSTPASIAKDLAAKLEREYFTKRRHAPKD